MIRLLLKELVGNDILDYSSQNSQVAQPVLAAIIHNSHTCNPENLPFQALDLCLRMQADDNSQRKCHRTTVQVVWDNMPCINLSQTITLQRVRYKLPQFISSPSQWLQGLKSNISGEQQVEAGSSR